MEEKKVLEEPEVTTYRREELGLETVFVGFNSGTGESDRNLKENVRPLDAERILETLLRL
jgi:hypothetical protein